MSPLATREVLWLLGSLLLGILLAGLTSRQPRISKAVTWLEDGWWLPAFAGLVTAVVTAYTWGSWTAPQPRVQDEAAYIFQAEVFAGGKWVAPPPPLPEFFKQMHVLEAPVRASKYPPGHSLVLAPGVALGLPPLMPLLLAGGSAWLLIVLGRLLAGGGVAISTWLLWLSSDLGLRWRPSYFSQGTTVFCALAMWLALHLWLKSRERRWLFGVAVALGWMAVTRPLTALALGIPVILVVGWSSLHRRSLHDAAAAMAAGVLIISLLPIWAARTTGHWSEWPLTRYTADYIPWDQPGLGLDSTASHQKLPTPYERLTRGFQAVHAGHTLAALPETARLRIETVARSGWNGWRRWLVPAFLIGLVVLPHAGLFAIGTSLALFSIMLTYAHPVSWTLYYTELAPLLAFFTSAGLARLVMPERRRLSLPPEPKYRLRISVGALALLPLVVHTMSTDVRRGRALRTYAMEGERALVSALSSLADERAIVFLRYPDDHHGHDVLLRNSTDLEGAMVWRVHDLGEGNARLLEAAPNRTAYVWDVGPRILTRY